LTYRYKQASVGRVWCSHCAAWLGLALGVEFIFARNLKSRIFYNYFWLPRSSHIRRVNGMSTIADLPNPLQIPVVDISGPDSEESIADQLVNAATVHGFVYIKNLGKDILIEDIDRAFDLVGLIPRLRLVRHC
jgi:hypothetical protein